MGLQATRSILFASVLLLSGCVGGESATPNDVQATDQAPPEASAATFDDETGAVQGTIINDEGLPVANVLVGVLETGLQTTTAQNGQYTFSNVLPGEYTVSAALLGFEAASKRVTVEAGAIAQANFQLVPVAIEQPYYVSVQELGNIQCSISWNPGAPLWAPDPSQPTNTSRGLLAPGWYTGLQACGVLDIVPGASSANPLPPTKFILQWENPAGTYELLAEMVWQSTQLTGRGLSFAYEHPDGVNDGSPTYEGAAGFSPLRDHVNNSELLEVNLFQGVDPREEDFPTQARGFSTANTTDANLPVPIPAVPVFGAPANQKADVGFALDQKFSIWQTSFVNQPMPENFSALADE
jgi:hypothetical protein